MTDYFRVTVQDLRTGEAQAVDVAEGDYILIPFGSCVLHHVQRSGIGSVQLGLRGHAPAGPPRPAPAARPVRPET